MAIEIQRLVSTYEADISPFERAVRQLPKISDKALSDVTNKAKVQAKAQEIVQKTMADASIREQKRATSAIVTEFNRRQKEIEKAQNQSAKASKSIFSSAFEGGFAGSLVSSITSRLSEIPAKVSEVMTEAVKISSERINAMKGLESIADFKGIDPTKAQEAVRNLRLVKAGVVDVGEATTALKNLLATGFSLPQAVMLMERFSDSAAFGKQAALGYGQAIAGATEGIKNQNSVLVDNAGVTKNLSVILKERGYELEDLSDKTKKQGALEALYKGLLAETAAQVGDADKLTQGYTGTIASLNTAYNNLYAAGGDLVTQSPEIAAAYRIQKEQVETLTDGLKNQSSETAKTAKAWLAFYAKVTAGTYPFIATISNSFMVAANALAGAGAAIAGTLALAVESTTAIALGAIASMYNPAATVFNSIQEAIGSTVRLGTIEWNQLGAVSNKAFADMKTSFDEVAKYSKKANASAGEFKATLADVDTYALDILQKQGKIKLGRTERDNWLDNAPKKRKSEDEPTSSGSGGRGKIRRAKNTDDRGYKDLIAFAKSQGFAVTSGFRTKGTTGAHAAGIAADISVKGKSGQEIAEFIVAALKKGFRIFDERVKSSSSPYWTGPHLHAETNNRKESIFNSNLGYGNIPLAYLQQLDNERFTKERGFDSKDVDKFNEQTKKDAEKQSQISTALAALSNAQLLYGREAIKIPETVDEILDAYKELKLATRERVAGIDKSVRPRTVNEIPDWALGQQGDPSATRPRQTPWQLIPGNEWGLDFQGDTSVTRARVVPDEKSKTEWTGFAEDVSSILGNAFNNLRERGFKGMLSGMVLDFTQSINQMAVQWFTSELFKGISGQSSGGQSGGWLSRLLGIGISALGSVFGGGIGKSAAPALGSASSAFGGGSSFGSTLSAVGGGGKFFNLAGARADGGPVEAGKNYLVGERGVEVFTPKTSGFVTANQNISNVKNANSSPAMNLTVVQHISVMPGADKRSAQASQDQAAKAAFAKGMEAWNRR